MTIFNGERFKHMQEFENEIIKVNYNREKPTVSARELYKRLEIKYRFSRWVESNFSEFAKNEDYFGADIDVRGNQYGGTQTLDDYDLTIDMAKHLCLMSKTPKGKKCRQDLIDLEKAWNSPEQVMARALKMANETIDKMKNQNALLIAENEQMKPKAEYFDELVDRNLLTSFRTTAKELGVKEGAFIGWLLDNKYIYRDQKNKLCPYATQKTEGLFEVKEYKSRYSDHAGTQTLITPRGRETFRILMNL